MPAKDGGMGFRSVWDIHASNQAVTIARFFLDKAKRRIIEVEEILLEMVKEVHLFVFVDGKMLQMQLMPQINNNNSNKGCFE